MLNLQELSYIVVSILTVHLSKAGLLLIEYEHETCYTESKNGLTFLYVILALAIRNDVLLYKEIS